MTDTELDERIVGAFNELQMTAIHFIGNNVLLDEGDQTVLIHTASSMTLEKLKEVLQLAGWTPPSHNINL